METNRRVQSLHWETVSCGVQLILDEPEAVYYAGQLLSGRIECNLDRPKNFAAINVTFLGEAIVDWNETETQEYGRARVLDVHHKGRETYFNYTQGLLGRNGHSPSNGIHKFPFQFQIPSTVPSSFTSSSAFQGMGKVCYSVTAQILYSDAEQEREDISKSFQVIDPLDLNKCNYDIKKPLTLEFEEYYSCCCSSSPISVTVSLPQSGFCPGEDIPITITSKNDSWIEIKRMMFQLVRKECYRSRQPISSWAPPETVLASASCGPVLSNTKQKTSRRLKVPDVVAPNLQHCTIIDVNFFLKVTIELSGCNDNMEDETEICLGLVPLSTSENAQKYKHPLKHKLPQAPIPQLENIPHFAPSVDTYQNYSMPNLGSTIPYPKEATVPLSNAPFPSRMVSHAAASVPHAYAGSTIAPASATPYQGSATPYQGSATPYQGSATDNLNSTTPYPKSNPTTPYPTSNTPYPTSNTPYPTSNTPYQTSNTPYQTSNTPHPTSNTPYQTSNTPHPTSNTPYQTSDTPHPTSITPYPTSGTPYPTSNTPYPISDAPHPTSNTPYPISTTPYPDATIPCPTFTAPYPTVTMPHPNSSVTQPAPTMPMPYPCSDPPYPITESLPTNTSLRTGTLGFLPTPTKTSLRTGTLGFLPTPTKLNSPSVMSAPYPTVDATHIPLTHRGNAVPTAPSSDS